MEKAASRELSALPELRFNLAGPGVQIVYPVLPAYAEVARELAAALESLTNAKPAMVVETEPNALSGDGPLVVLGNLMESTTVRRLYYECYDFTDLAFPGPGGFALRTIRDPFGTGAHGLLLGGSDVQGVRDAAARLVARVRNNGAVLGHVNDVKLGQWTTAAELDPARYLADTEEVWSRVGESGSWEYMEQIAGCGLGYLRTGDERYIKLFRRELHFFKSHDVYAPNPEAPQQIHGRIYLLLILWDLVQDHPGFTLEDRREFDEMFLYLERSGEGVAQISERSKTWAVRFNHDTRAALDAFFVGRYFDRRHHLPEAKGWLKTARDIFDPQLASAKPAEDSWGHQWVASMHNTLSYAMAAGRHEYFTSDAFKHAAERALMAHGRDGPRVYLANCTVVTGDSAYLGLERDGESFMCSAARLRLSKPTDSSLPASFEEGLRSFAATTVIARRETMLGLTLAPVDPLWYRTIETSVYNPGGIFRITIKEDEGFDKLAIREGWAAQDFYLLLDGISGGLHSFQDANCLVWLREGGVDWFRTKASYERAQGVRAQNGVNVVLNGRGFQQVHRYARLLYRDTRDEFIATGTCLGGIGEATWERHVLRKRGAWTLVVDRVRVHVEGELLVERFWYPAGDLETTGNGFTSRQSFDDTSVTLHIASTVDTGGRDQAYAGFRERVRVKLPAGDDRTLAALICTSESGDAAISLRETTAGFIVTDADGVTTEVKLHTREGQGCGLAVAVGARRLKLGQAGKSVAPGSARILPLVAVGLELPSEFREWGFPGKTITEVAARTTGSVLGTADGIVVSLDPELQERWRTQVSGAVLSLEISAEGVVVGQENGTVSLFDFTGHKLWAVQIPWVSLPWSNWSECRSRIREIACADINGDGREEIIISNADRRVYAFDHDGRELWKRPIEWGVFTAMWPGTHENGFALLGGTSRPSIHGYVVMLNGDGTVRGHIKRADLICWGLPANTRDLQSADIDGDGCMETIAAVDTNCRQLIAYGADGAVKWDCDVGACAAALTFDSVTSRVLVTSEAGYVVAVEGGTGQRAWVTWIGETAELIWVLPDGRVAAVAQRGVIWMILPTGEIQGRIDLGEPITAIPRPGNHRGPGRRFMLGTASGRLLTQSR